MALPLHRGKVLQKERRGKVLLLSLATTDFNFVAGQYLALNFGGKLYYYSILSNPSQKEKVDLAIKFYDDKKMQDFENIAVDQELEIHGPAGNLTFDEITTHDHYFIAGGTGIAPLYSMITEYIARFLQHQFVLLFSVKEKEDLFLHEQCLSLAKKYSNFSYIPTLTRGKWEGAMGRVQIHFPLDVEKKTFYICGPKEMVKDVQTTLLLKGVHLENIKS